MMRRLRGEEALDAYEGRVAVSPQAKPAARRSIVRKWQREAMVGRDRPKAIKAPLHTLKGTGIGVRRVKKPTTSAATEDETRG